MALVEITRFPDVYEAGLAAAFLADQGIQVEVTERFQTTVDPLMQRALGVRLMAPSDQVETARDLLARAAGGEFATEDEDDLVAPSPTTRNLGRGLALTLAVMGAFWGNSLPQRLRTIHWIGVALIAGIIALSLIVALSI